MSFLQKAIEDGEDYERKLFWKFSAESVEAWEEKMAKKKERANVGFTGMSLDDLDTRERERLTWI